MAIYDFGSKENSKEAKEEPKKCIKEVPINIPKTVEHKPIVKPKAKKIQVNNSKVKGSLDFDELEI